MATAADKKKWDKLHDDYAKAREAESEYDRRLHSKYGRYESSWLTKTERAKIDALSERSDKIGDKIIDLLVEISPRGDRWLSGVPSWWLREKLTWEDATRPADEPLSVVVPGSYGYPDGYMKERRRTRMADDKEIPIANPGDYSDDSGLFQFQFGAYADTKVYVWADSFDDAEEIAIEWADDNARGVFVTLTEDDLKEAAEDLGIEWDEVWSDGGAVGRQEFGQTWTPFDDPDYEKIVQQAEADLIVVGWTQLKSGTHVISHEVHAHEVTDADEYEEVAERSEEESPWDEEGGARESPQIISEPNDARDILEGLGPYMQHEGHDAPRESARIARMIAGVRGDADRADKVLEEVDRLVGGHGIEAIRDEEVHDNYYGDVVALYVNMGDTYDTTLVYDTDTQEFQVTSWGDWYEAYEQDQGPEDGEDSDEDDDYDDEGDE